MIKSYETLNTCSFQFDIVLMAKWRHGDRLKKEVDQNHLKKKKKNQ